MKSKEIRAHVMYRQLNREFTRRRKQPVHGIIKSATVPNAE